jgi:hypothetical protein
MYGFAVGLRSTFVVCLFLITTSLMALAGTPAPVSVSPNQGSGTTQDFTFTFSDSSGWTSLKQVNINIGASSANANTCLVSYVPSSQWLYLLNDAGNAYLPGAPLGSTATIHNSQCSINVQQTGSAGAGNNLTLHVTITFTSAYFGNKSIYLGAVDNSGASSGWKALGTWTVGMSSGGTCSAGAAPSVTICSPTNGSTVATPVHLVAVPSSSNGVVAMAVYFDNTLVYKQNVQSINTLINAAAGAHYVVVQFWDNSGNVPAKASENITVGSTSSGPPTISFTANPTSIASGASSTLTWSTANATSVTIDNGVGSKPASGSASVSPTTTTTYTLTATGPSGTSTARATVTVTSGTPPPTINFTASPTSISAGQSSTLTWSTGNATSVTISNGVGSEPTSGSASVTPTATTTYTLTATGPGGTSTATATVSVAGSITCNSSSVTNCSVTPNQGTGLSQAFSFAFADSTGWSYLKQVNVDIGLTQANANSCLVSYVPSTNKLYLLNDTGTAYLAGIAIGSAGTLQNSQCSVNVGQSSASGSGNGLTLNVAMTFNSSYAGSDSIFMDAVDNGGRDTGWQVLGHWTVGGSTGGGGGTCNVGAAPSVTICSPTNGSTVPSPVHVVAAPASNTGVVAMAVYFDNTLVYKANVNKVDTLVNAAVGSHYVVVQFWDNSGNVPAKASENITVASGGTGGGSGPISVTPQVATIYPNGTQQFTAQANGSAVSVSWYVDGIEGGNSSVGSISTGGLYTAPGTVGAHEIKAVSTADPTQSALAVVNVVDPNHDMTTYHNDLARTGANTSEAILSPSNVSPSRFGKLGSYAVDGQVYAQPLYIPDLTFNGARRNVVYVATEHDSVYALDADFKIASPYWSVSLLGAGMSPVASTDGLGVSPEIGVTSTPVIDRTNNVMYVLAYVSTAGGNQFWLHALDLLSGSERFGGPKRVTAAVAGSGVDSSGGQIQLESGCWQRSGLALNNGQLYIAFGHCAHGWIVAYNPTTLAQTAVVNTTPDGAGGTIWMGGGAPAFDSGGDLYVITGTNFGAIASSGYNDAFMKFTPSLGLLDYFIPDNNATLVANDVDLGSGAPVVLPDNSSAHPHEIVGAGKDGRIFLLDRDNMGKFDPNGNHVIQAIQSGATQWGNFFDTPAVWNGRIYYHGSSDVLRAFNWTNGLLSTSPAMTGSTVFTAHGATPTVSANGAGNGILWELQLDGQPSNPAILHAYDASNISHELYNSNMNASDKAGPAVKFTVPTVVNGKVYVPAGHEVDIYGLVK